MAEIVLPVEGMRCVSCVARVTEALQGLAGVRAVDVNLEKGQAQLDYDETAVQRAVIAQAIRDAGFQTAENSALTPRPAALEATTNPASEPAATLPTEEAAELDQARLEISGMHCASCVSRVEQALNVAPGVMEARVHLAISQATVRFDPNRTNTDQLAAAVRAAGYGARLAASDPTEHAFREGKEAAYWRSRLIVAMMILPVMVAIHWLTPFSLSVNRWLLLALATPLQLYVGWPYFSGAWIRLTRGSVSMDTLVALGTGVSYVAGIVSLATDADVMGFVDAGMILTFITLGKYLEAKAKGRASLAVRKLLDLSPRRATLLREDRQEQVMVDNVSAGEVMLVRPGERIPLDAEILRGRSDVDESWLTGESVPVDKQPGDTIFSGTINGQAALTARVTRISTETALAQVIELVRHAQESKADVQRVADRVVTWFVPVVLLIAAATFLIWTGAGHIAMGLGCTVAVLVVACPCALGLATPMAIIVGSGRGAEQGILIKNASALETAGRITTVVLDKTGTVTAGQPEIVAVEPVARIEEGPLVAWAAAAESLSTHPLAKAVVAYASEHALQTPTAEHLIVRAGQGIEAVCDGKAVLVGNEELMQERGIAVTSEAMQDIECRRHPGHTALWVAVDQELKGILYAADVERPSSAEAVDQLRRLGLRIIMLSGDRRITAEAVAQRVGIHEVLAEVHPDGKQIAINRLQESGEIVAMVGDGINDAPALASADLGVAIGSGADVAVEAADVVLTRNDLRAVPQTIGLSRATLRTIRQNLGWALWYNILLLPLAAGVAMPLWGVRVPPVLAAAAMAASSVSVVCNSLRLRHKLLDSGSGRAPARPVRVDTTRPDA
ncbi:MAG: heavy metal translocating P-type ATPase [Pirellulaceae bacterium]